MKKRSLWVVAAILICGVSVFTACTSNKDNAGTDEKSGADLVVIGKIFTSENNQVAEAFAVKDGKYVYVGDKKGAEAYIENGKTEVMDYTGKGLVMPGCGNGHAHYSMAYALRVAGTTVGGMASAGVSWISRIICLPVSKWMLSAVIFLFTLQTMKVIRHWSIPSCW